MTGLLRFFNARWRRTGNRWQPIETAPRDGTLIEARNAATVATGWTFKARWGAYQDRYTGISTTGWHTPTGHRCEPEEWRQLKSPGLSRHSAARATVETLAKGDS